MNQTARRGRLVISCFHCKGIFSRIKSMCKVKNYCSYACSSGSRMKRKEIKCAVCSEVFIRCISQSISARYCSRACMSVGYEKKSDLICTLCKLTYKVPKSIVKWNKIRGRKTNFCSNNCKYKFNSGKTHFAWLKDRGMLKCRPNGNADHQEWRRKIFQRDNYTCKFCGARNGNGKDVYLEADHIKPWALFPELRFVINNGRTLCRPCHNTTKMDPRKMERLWGRKIQP